MIRVKRSSPEVMRCSDPRLLAMINEHREFWSLVYRAIMQRESREWRGVQAKRAVPAEQRADYRHLTQSKRFSTVEALSILGVQS